MEQFYNAPDPVTWQSVEIGFVRVFAVEVKAPGRVLEFPYGCDFQLPDAFP
jgi:hypothetical protein